jgi:hypothetical protein
MTEGYSPRAKFSVTRRVHPKATFGTLRGFASQPSLGVEENETPAAVRPGLSLVVVVPAGAVAAPPQITVPGHVIAEASGPTGADVSYTVTATNAAGKPANVSCTPPGAAATGTLTVTAHFPLGDTTVTCTVGENGTVTRRRLSP